MAEAGAGLLSRLARGAGEAFGFRHGVHPPESKELTAHLPIRRMPYPEEVVLPLRQHAGKPARVVVRKGDHVERGDTVATADGRYPILAEWMASPSAATPDEQLELGITFLLDGIPARLPKGRAAS